MDTKILVLITGNGDVLHNLLCPNDPLYVLKRKVHDHPFQFTEEERLKDWLPCEMLLGWVPK